MATELRNNLQRSRYELAIDDELIGIADYHVEGEVVVFPHTEIDRFRRGQGLGAQLVRYALDDVRSANRRVEPRCWFVAEFIADNPEYADLVP